MLSGWIQDGMESLGLNGSDVKPVNTGEEVTVVNQGIPVSSAWDFLDKIGDTVTNGVGEYVGGLVQNQVDKIQTGSESTVDSTGDPSDQAGQNFGAGGRSMSFIQENKTPLIIGGAVLLLGGLFVVMRGSK
tara:strand:+ start:2640 stop:3032 length:393 start_codon:yes stop_codon:yes gene_type:complete